MGIRAMVFHLISHGFGSNRSVFSGRSMHTAFSRNRGCPEDPRSLLLWKEHKMAGRENYACRPVAGTCCGGRLSLWSAFGVIQLPAQNILVLPSDERGAIWRTQGQNTRAHSIRTRRFDFSRGQNGSSFVKSSEIDLAFRRPRCHVS